LLKIAVDKPVDYVALLGLLSITSGLPFSRFLISCGGFLLLIYLVISKRLFTPSKYLKNPLVLGFLLLFAIHLIALLWTVDMTFAMKDLRIKLPILLYPIALFSVKDLAKKNSVLLIGSFCLSLLLCSAFIFVHQMGWGWKEIIDFRSLSPKVSHIRLGLMYAAGIALCVEVFFYAKRITNRNLQLVTLLFFSVFLYSLNALQAVTALAALAISVFIILTIYIYRKKNLVLALLPSLVFFGAIVGSIAWHFLAKEEVNKTQLLTQKTALGNTYSFDFSQHAVENGHYIWQQIAAGELNEALQLRTGKTLSDTIENGAMLYGVVLRYMSSKGLVKDAAGVSLLTDDDVENIMAGVCNYKTQERLGFVNRYHQLMREVDMYLSNGDASGNTMLQRLVYWETAFYILKNNVILGTGTGDIKQAFDDAYIELNVDLPKAYRFRAHNQYLSFFVAFGMAGGILVLVSLAIIVAYWLRNTKAIVWKVSVLSIVFLSFLTEDTLETQVGVTLVTFMLCTVLFTQSSQEHESV